MWCRCRRIVSIAYRDEFREVMDYFRALYAAGERSSCAADLNPSNYTVRLFQFSPLHIRTGLGIPIISLSLYWTGNWKFVSLTLK
jgi:hypothetical protein